MLFIVTTDLLAAVLTMMTLCRGDVSASQLLCAGVIAAFAIGYRECAVRVARLKRYLGANHVFSNLVSVWTFAAVLAVPTGYAMAVTVVIYLHVWWQRRRDNSSRTYRIVLTGAAVTLAVFSGSLLLDDGSAKAALRGDVPADCKVVLAALVCMTVNIVIVLAAMRLATPGVSVRSLVPPSAAMGSELAASVLGLMAAEFVLQAPVLLPLILIPVVHLHRSSLVTTLSVASRTDPKTSLLNFAAWTEHAQAALSQCLRTSRPAAVMVLDVDNFKDVNDNHGHLAGDEVLAGIARCMKTELRTDDGLGRFGGDEFVAVIEDLDLLSATRIAHRLQHAVGALHAGPRAVSVSIGLAHTSGHPGDLSSLLAAADRSVYEAKAAGRGRLVVAEPTSTMHRHVLERTLPTG